MKHNTEEPGDSAVSAIPNPHNDYVPIPGELVRVVGGCHPDLLGRIVKVRDVYDNWADIEYEDSRHGTIVTGGELGGLEPLVAKENPPQPTR